MSSKKHSKASYKGMKAKLKMKEYQDTQSHAKPSPITAGETVIVKQPKRNKLTIRFRSLKLRLHNAIYRLLFYSNSLIHIVSLSNSHNNVASSQNNRGDKSHYVIVALYRVSQKKYSRLTNYHAIAFCSIV